MMKSTGRLFAISDVHTDKMGNMEWIKALQESEHYGEDTLILAGDVTHRPQIMKETLEIIARVFGTVFFCPGNHDLWVKGPKKEMMEGKTSLDRLDELLVLCEDIGIHTKPAISAGVIVVPILAWHHPQWDVEPDITGWTGIPSVEELLMDYHMTVWPSGVRQEDGSAARRIDELNDTLQSTNGCLENEVAKLKAEYPDAPIVTFSHFLPRIELCPEKRYLTFPNLIKGVGSEFLRIRVANLKPQMHVFGHTHFGWDATLDDGVRYIQAALSYPEERKSRLPSVACGDNFPHAVPHEPLLIYDSATCKFAPKYNARWSDFYENNQRQPHVTSILAPYVARRYKREPFSGGVGYAPGIEKYPSHFGPKSTLKEENSTTNPTRQNDLAVNKKKTCEAKTRNLFSLFTRK